METVDAIRGRLKGVFTEHQADVLARVLVEAFPIPARPGDRQSRPGDRGDVTESPKPPERPGETG